MDVNESVKNQLIFKIIQLLYYKVQTYKQILLKLQKHVHRITFHTEQT